MRLHTALSLTALLVATASLAGDPTLLYRAPSLVPHGGAWPGHRPAALAPRDLHAAAINARAQAGIEAAQRDNMRRIDNGVIRRLGNPASLPQVRRQRELEEGVAGMRQRERRRRIEAEFGNRVDWRGQPLGSTTRRVLEESAIQLWVRERKDGLARDLDHVASEIEGPHTLRLYELVSPVPRIVD